jgi:hypothetical protein
MLQRLRRGVEEREEIDRGEKQRDAAGAEGM